jgi:hypothetical protein
MGGRTDGWMEWLRKGIYSVVIDVHGWITDVSLGGMVLSHTCMVGKCVFSSG